MKNTDIKANFLLWLKAAHSPETVKSYDNSLRNLWRWLDEERKDLPECSLSDLVRYGSFLEGRGLKSGTRNSYVSALRAVWKWLREQGIVTMSETMIPLPQKIDVESIPCQEPEMLEKMLGCFDEFFPRDLRDKTIMRFLFLTGLRQCEMRSIKTSKLDIHKRQAYVKTFKRKNHFRWVYFDDETARLLTIWLEVRDRVLERSRTASDWLFISLNSSAVGDAMSKHAVIRAFKYAREKSKIKTRISAHSARHGHATFLAKMGMDIWKLKDDMGHANLKSTQVYVHMKREDIQEQHEKAFQQFNH